MDTRQSAAATIEAQVDNLLAQMTLDEKLAQLTAIYVTELLEGKSVSPEKCRQALANGIGQISRIGGDQDLEPWESAKIANDIQRFLTTETRLKIPAIVHEECLSGFMVKRATVFPQAIGLASAWDPALVERMTTSVRHLMKRTGVHQGLSPVLDVCREPRWGRIEETFGEDPYLVTANGMAYIHGLQTDDLAQGIMATGKHFAGHGIPEGGHNQGVVRLGPREFRETYLFPFEACVKAGKLATMMNAYHEMDGIPCASSRELLTGVLREEWGFDGMVVSDYGTIDMLTNEFFVAADKKEAAKMSLEAGLDIEMPSPVYYREPLREAVAEGSVSEETVDIAVRRVLRMKLRVGLFAQPCSADEAVTLADFDSAENQQLSLEAGCASLVLLKNAANALPLPKTAQSIAVIGPNAHSRDAMLGDYSYFMSRRYWSGIPSDYTTLQVVTALEGIRTQAPEGCTVHYAPGCEADGISTELFAQAVETARQSDVVIAVMGENAFAISGEGRDRDTLRLPGVQEELIKELAATGVPVVLVLLNGRPPMLAEIEPYCAAIVEAWYPGEEGGNAIARALFGEYNPGGKLPVTFPLNVGQLPMYYGKRPVSNKGYYPTPRNPAVCYPFGHGLSYTTFAYRDLHITPGEVAPGDAVTISVTVQNIGEMAGDEVVQLYLHDTIAPVVRPIKELRGFHKLRLQPGEAKTVTFTVSTEQLAFYDIDMRLVIDPGAIEVFVGSSSEDIRQTGTFHIGGEKTAIEGRTVFLTPSKEK
ncbi:MAG: glycoside hydrolase family 3 N-terminal domain-containing protein [Armatimonadota bacterium]